MKKLIFSLCALMLGIGLAWADGVKVSGTVTPKEIEGSYMFYSNYVELKNADASVVMRDVLRSDYVDGKNVFQYEFTGVTAGTYSVTIRAICSDFEAQTQSLYGKTQESIVVATTDVSQNIELQQDGEYTLMAITPQHMVEQYGYLSPATLGGVEITCQKKGTEDKETVISAENGGNVLFYCDTVSTYMVTLKKAGYKDTVHETKAWEKAYESASSKSAVSLNIVMKEDLGNQVTLKGTVAVKDMPDAQLNGFGLKVFWGEKTYQTKIVDGAYEFSERIPVGEVVYQLFTVTTSGEGYYAYDSWNNTQNWQFETNQKDTLHYTLAGEDEATVTNNLTVVRVGTDISGAVVDSSATYPSPLSGVAVVLSSAQSKDSVNTGYSNNFSFSGIKDGTYTLTLTKDGYTAEPKTITVSLANMKLDSTIQLGNIAMVPAESDFAIFGTAYYYDNQMVYLKNAKVVCYSDAEYTTKLDSAYTNENGEWSMTVRCYPSTNLYLVVFHEDIEPGTGNTSRQAQYMVGSSVTISCQKKFPPVYGMQNCKAKQDFTNTEKLAVTLTWEWPEEFNYDGTTYNIGSIQVERSQNGKGFTNVANLYIENNTLPTAHVDSVSMVGDSLSIDSTYVYRFNVVYYTPSKTVTVEDPNNLTVKLLAEEPEYYSLTLNVNDETMGTVTGAGEEYAEGTEVTINAIANDGYEFVAWMHETDTVAKTAEHKVVMTQDSTLTAVFKVEERPVVVKDSFNLVLKVDSKMGTVEGAGKYEENTEVTIKAIANTGYDFVAWVRKANDTVAKTAEYNVDMTQNDTLTAVFVANGIPVDSVTLTLNVDATMGKVEGAGKYEKGEEVTVKAIANSGYEFVAWMSGDDTVVTTAEYKFILNSDSTLTAVFVKETANEDREQAAWSVSVENQTIVLRSVDACQYDVYNMAGSLVKRAKANSNEYRIAVNNSGLYIVRRISATGYSVKKVMVR